MECAPCSVSSTDVNAYLSEFVDEHFTAKDYRTWWGTVLALKELGRLETPSTKTAVRQAISGVVKTVAEQLRNTPAVCRKCYIHPRVIDCFLEGNLQPSASQACDAESLLIDILGQDATAPKPARKIKSAKEKAPRGR